MNKKMTNKMRIFFSAIFFIGFSISNASVIIDNLLTEYTKTPIGIDVKTPRFSWQMVANGNERGSSFLQPYNPVC
jgi:hypothetical protein